MPMDWRELSEAASREQDPQKLLELVEELDKALEQHEKEMREKNRGSNEHARDKESNLHPTLPVTVPLSA
ncbi:MAG: hypothetical protein ACRD2S_07900 [Terriglobales bacterium]